MERMPRNRLIVALDGVATADDALRLVDDLEGLVSFYKIGWELFMAGQWLAVVKELERRQARVFLDLKLPGDIPATIESAVKRACEHPIVELLTLSAGVPKQTIAAARAGRGERPHPKLLSVPFLSSLDATDVRDVAGASGSAEIALDDFILERSRLALAAGCDGLIASGDSIALLRFEFETALLVSPGIRPAGSSADDHKRSTTPSQAIEMGADYLVVGRPVRALPSRDERRAMAARIVSEIESSASRRAGA